MLRLFIVACVAIALAGCMIFIARDVPQREIPWPFGKEKAKEKERERDRDSN